MLPQALPAKSTRTQFGAGAVLHIRVQAVKIRVRAVQTTVVAINVTTMVVRRMSAKNYTSVKPTLARNGMTVTMETPVRRTVASQEIRVAMVRPGLRILAPARTPAAVQMTVGGIAARQAIAVTTIPAKATTFVTATPVRTTIVRGQRHTLVEEMTGVPPIRRERSVIHYGSG